MGDGRAEGSSAIGDGGQAAISLMHDVDGTHVCIFESSQLEGSNVGDSLSFKMFKNLYMDLVPELWPQICYPGQRHRIGLA